MPKLKILAAAAVALLTSISSQADTVSLTPTSGSGWMAITPVGNLAPPCCSTPVPITSVGLAWEASNVGWNSSASYDASAWSAYSGGIPSIASPLYARLVIDIPGTPTSGLFNLFVDDDSMAWVNGTLVPDLNDQSLGTGNNSVDGNADITQYLHSGLNVIAFKAFNSVGGGYSVTSSGSVTFTPASNNAPEPASWALALVGLLAAAGSRRARATA